jgi:hypothetical protein
MIAARVLMTAARASMVTAVTVRERRKIGDKGIANKAYYLGTPGAH